MSSLRRSFCQILQDLSNEPPVEESDTELIRAFQSGDVCNAGHKLLIRHYKMILKVTISITNGKWFDDSCIHAGAVGIYEAAKRFDTEKGYTFLTYAVPWIRKYVMLEVCNDVLPAGGIVFGRDFKVGLFRYIGYRMAGETNEMIAERLKLSASEIRKFEAAASMTSRPVSLSSFDGADDEHDALDMHGVPSFASAEDEYIESNRGRHWYSGVKNDQQARQRAIDDICVVVEAIDEGPRELICKLLGICGYDRKDDKELMQELHLGKEDYIKKRRNAYYKLKMALERAGM